MYDMAEAVQRGARWLDRNSPGWYNKINTNTLLMSSCALCVLGQIGFYNNFCSSLGFDLCDSDYQLNEESRDYAWNKLRDLWLEEIRGRLQ